MFSVSKLPSYHSKACAIEDLNDNSLLITGGLDESGSATNRVTKYRGGGIGIFSDMPKLNTGRSEHGCACAIYRDRDDNAGTEFVPKNV